MALIFPRIARNFIKNGYFPTDLDTLDRVASALDVVVDSAAGEASVQPPLRILDPCCGEGAALAHLQQHLLSCGAPVTSLGVEVDEDRAWHAKALLDLAAHADIHDVRISERSVGLLFLNPPYGDLVADRAGTGHSGAQRTLSTDGQGRERHEKLFVRRCLPLLQFGGVLVLVVPFTVLDQELATLLARHLGRVEVFLAPEQQFRQCVVFGVRRRASTPNADVVARLLAFGRGEDQPTLPERWAGEPYLVPPPKAGETFAFNVTRLDARQLAAELHGLPGGDDASEALAPHVPRNPGLQRHTLWPRFTQLLRRRAATPKRPLRAMTDWHLALALAAGQITGIVTSATGQRLLIKGRTHKTKDCRVLREVAADGSVSETRVLTDRFVTVIRGIDLTPGDDLGRIVTIA